MGERRRLNTGAAHLGGARSVSGTRQVVSIKIKQERPRGKELEKLVAAGQDITDYANVILMQNVLFFYTAKRESHINKS